MRGGGKKNALLKKHSHSYASYVKHSTSTPPHLTANKICYHLYYLTSLCLLYISVPTHFIVFILEQCVLCIFAVRISVLQNSTFCGYALKYSFLPLYCLCTFFDARRIYPQAMTAIMTDGYLKVIHSR